jgi:hypothetical protein
VSVDLSSGTSGLIVFSDGEELACERISCESQEFFVRLNGGFYAVFTRDGGILRDGEIYHGDMDRAWMTNRRRIVRFVPDVL